MLSFYPDSVGEDDKPKGVTAAQRQREREEKRKKKERKSAERRRKDKLKKGILSRKKHCECPFLHMGLVVRKPVFGVSDQVRHKLGCTATEDG